MQFAKLTAGE